jgi:hypothetical protein
VYLYLSTRPLDLVENPRYHPIAVPVYDNCYGFYQTSPVLVLTLPLLPIPRRSVVVYGFLRIAYRLRRLTLLARRPRRLLPYRLQLIARFSDLPVLLRRRATAYTLTLSSYASSLYSVHVTSRLLFVEQRDERFRHTSVIDSALLLPYLYRLLRLLLLYL